MGSVLDTGDDGIAEERTLPPESYNDARGGRAATLQEFGLYEVIARNALARLPNYISGNYDKIQFKLKEDQFIKLADDVVHIFSQEEMFRGPETRVNAEGEKDDHGFQAFPTIQKNCAYSDAIHKTISKLSNLVIELRLRDPKDEVRYSYLLKEEFNKALTDPVQYLENSRGNAVSQ